MSLKESIRRILREEVSKKYSKPSENIEKLINNWLTNFFSGSKMYYEETYKSRHDFEWCNKGLKIAQVILYFHNDENVYNDIRPTSERKFINGSLWIPKDIVNDLLSFVPIRRNYLRYMIEEWFEDNWLEVIQDKMGRNDISLDEFKEYPDKTEKCVPPIEKPEGVTKQEMMDLIKKTTLYSYKDMERHEEETPGWIEKLYLGKLRNAEIERVRRN